MLPEYKLTAFFRLSLFFSPRYEFKKKKNEISIWSRALFDFVGKIETVGTIENIYIV